MAQPTVVSGTGLTNPSTNSLVMTAPSSIVEGNLLVAFIGCYNTVSAWTPPSGFTFLRGEYGSGMWVKIATGSEPSTYTWTWTGTAGVAAGAIVQVEASGATTVNVHAHNVNGTSTNITCPSVNNGYGSAAVLVSFYESFTATTLTVPGSQTEVSGTSATGNTLAITVGYDNPATSGATGTRVATGGSATSYGFSACVYGSVTKGFARTPVFANPGALGVVGHVGVSNDAGYKGYYKVLGHTKQKTTADPLFREVRLLTMSGKVVRRKQSVAVDGSFAFLNVPAGKYIVLGIDQTLTQNAVVVALIDAVAM